MIGSVTEAEDSAQEAFLRLERGRPGAGRSSRPRPTWRRPPRGWPSTSSLGARAPRGVRRCRGCPSRCDRRGRRTGRPRPTPSWPTLSMAFLVLLESLTPVERAVFLLREVFDYRTTRSPRSWKRARTTAGSSPRRAPRHVDTEQPRFEPSRAAHERYRRFLAAASGRRPRRPQRACSPHDAVFTGDGGGKAAALRPVSAASTLRARCARSSARAARDRGRHGRSWREVNGQPGWVAPRGRRARVIVVMALGHPRRPRARRPVDRQPGQARATSARSATGR